MMHQTNTYSPLLARLTERGKQKSLYEFIQLIDFGRPFAFSWGPDVPQSMMPTINKYANYPTPWVFACRLKGNKGTNFFSNREELMNVLRNETKFTVTDEKASTAIEVRREPDQLALMSNGKIINHDLVESIWFGCFVPLTSIESPATVELESAIKQGSSAAAKKALDAGASVEFLPDKFCSPLGAAISPKISGDWEGICRLLVQAGAPVGGYHWENAHICNAVDPFRDEASDIQAIKCLLSLGADLNAQDRTWFSGYTPLHHAVMREKLAVAKFLLSLDPRVDLKDAVGGRTPLDFAQQSAEYGDPKAIAMRDLLEAHLNGSARLDNYEQTATTSEKAHQAELRESKRRFSDLLGKLTQGLSDNGQPEE